LTSATILTRLPNGLTIHLKEIRTAPIISHWVWYRVGSRDETSGRTGISHWVEHMQFKGTLRFPASQLDKAIAHTGGTWNAFTHMDWTTYYETLPAAEIDLALDLERDRMTGSLFNPAEVEAERTVILSELEGNQNEPRYRLAEAVQSAAFSKHPYRNQVIGSRTDLMKIQRADLFSYYQAHYRPANAIVAIAGDFAAEEMLKRVTERYQDLESGQAIDRSLLPDPPLTGEQRVEVNGPGNTTYLNLAYRAPGAREEDFFAFSILDSILCGPTSLNIFGGGGTTNKTSRIYKALVDQDLAVGARGGLSATMDPYLYEISITIRPDHTVEEVLSALDIQITRLQEELVPAGELARAQKQARALFAYGSENITNQAFWLGYAEIFADYQWFTSYLDRLALVSAQDVQRIAQQYLVNRQRVVGIYRPGKTEEAS